MLVRPDFHHKCKSNYLINYSIYLMIFRKGFFDQVKAVDVLYLDFSHILFKNKFEQTHIFMEKIDTCGL